MHRLLSHQGEQTTHLLKAVCGELSAAKRLLQIAWPRGRVHSKTYNHDSQARANQNGVLNTQWATRSVTSRVIMKRPGNIHVDLRKLDLHVKNREWLVWEWLEQGLTHNIEIYRLHTTSNRACHPGSHYRDYHLDTLSLWLIRRLGTRRFLWVADLQLTHWGWVKYICCPVWIYHQISNICAP